MQAWGDRSPLTYTHFSNVGFATGLSLNITECTAVLAVHSVIANCNNFSKVINVELSLEKNSSRNILQPAFQLPCTLVLLENLAHPEWIKIDCGKSILSTYLCEIRIRSTRSLNDSVAVGDLSSFCPLNLILSTKQCVVITKTVLKFTESNFLEQYCELKGMSVMLFSTVKDLHLVTDAFQMSPIFSIAFGKLCRFEFDKTSAVYKTCQMTHNTTHGYHFCSMKKQTVVSFGGNLLKCGVSNELISSKFIGDKRQDCRDNTDESICYGSNHWKGRQQENNSYTCPALLFKQHDGKCVKYLGPKGKKLNSSKSLNHLQQYFQCGDLTAIRKELVDDLVPDCSDRTDEIVFSDVLHRKMDFPCNPNSLPCFPGHTKCFNISSLCTYKLNMFFHITPCRTGGHLASCKNIKCNMMYKCLESFCIPWSYVCDIKWDCPEGMDELNETGTELSGCTNMLKCTGTKEMCVHLGKICDGMEDCLQGEDEQFCDLHGFQCPKSCHCLLYALICRTGSFPFVKEVSHIFVQLGHFPIVTDFFRIFYRAKYLMIWWGNMTNICKSLLSKNLLVLDTAHNCINKIESGCLTIPLLVKNIDFRNNTINTIETHALSNLHSLSVLNLSSNMLTIFPSSILSPSGALTTLSLLQNSFTHFDANVFLDINVVNVQTDSFEDLLSCANQNNLQRRTSLVFFLQNVAHKQSSQSDFLGNFRFLSFAKFTRNLVSLVEEERQRAICIHCHCRKHQSTLFFNKHFCYRCV